MTEYIIRKRNDTVRDTWKQKLSRGKDSQCRTHIKTYINYSVMSAILNNKGVDELKTRVIQLHSIKP